MTNWVLLSDKGDSNDDDMEKDKNRSAPASPSSSLSSSPASPSWWTAPRPSPRSYVLSCSPKKITREESTTITGNDENHQKQWKLWKRFHESIIVLTKRGFGRGPFDCDRLKDDIPSLKMKRFIFIFTSKALIALNPLWGSRNALMIVSHIHIKLCCPKSWWCLHILPKWLWWRGWL